MIFTRQKKKKKSYRIRERELYILDLPFVALLFILILGNIGKVKNKNKYNHQTVVSMGI